MLGRKLEINIKEFGATWRDYTTFLILRKGVMARGDVFLDNLTLLLLGGRGCWTGSTSFPSNVKFTGPPTCI